MNIKGPKSLASSRVFSELQGTPWTSLVIKNQSAPIFIKSKFTDSCYYIIFTDLLRVWYRFSDKNSIKEEKLEYNPQFAATTTRILEILKDHFLEQKLGATYECTLDQQTLKMTLSLSTKIDFYMFQWAFECEQMQDGDDCHALYIREHIILPFIYTNKLLTMRQVKQSKQLEGGSILKRSRTSLIKDEPTLSDDEFPSPSECMTQPWFDQFTSRAYQRYLCYCLLLLFVFFAPLLRLCYSLSFFGMVYTVAAFATFVEFIAYVNSPQMQNSTKDCGGDGKGSSDSETNPLKPSLSHRFYSNPDLQLVYSSEEDQLDEEMVKNTRSNSDPSQGAEDGDSTGGEEESAEEIRRRKEIAERLERERAKKTMAVQNKRKRFV